MQDKRAMELSLNTIIIAVIILVVLIVVIIIFSTKFNVFGKTTVNCQAQGGYCNSQGLKDFLSLPACPEGETKLTANCTSMGDVCCIKVLS